jgi:uncharacterized protein
MTAGVILLAGGFAAGLFGSLLGLGGGILIVPLLTLVFDVPLRGAVAVSLVSVIVTSSAGAGVYLQRHVANLRLGMVLELFTATGALAGGLVAFVLPVQVLEALFAVLMVWVAVSMARRRDGPRTPVPAPVVANGDGAIIPDPHAEAAEAADPPPDATAIAASGAGPELVAPAPVTFTDRLGGPGYRVHRLPFGMVGALGAGVVSALLGVGGGIIKVPVMHLALGVPLRVAAATSNMMIGVTATSSAVIYLLRDEIDPFVAGPTAVGVFLGASVGSRIAHRVDARLLRWLFVLMLAYTAIEMSRKALGL